jgi:hypothetical protein
MPVAGKREGARTAMIAAHAPLTASTHAPAGHLLDLSRLRVIAAAMTDAAIKWVGQSLCGLRGHAMMMRFESTRLSLHCASCGRTTPGWEIEAARSRDVGHRVR